MWIKPAEQKIVGAVLGAARRAAGLNQAQLAKRLRKPQSFISAYENGQRRIDVLEFIRIAKVLEASPATLFGEIVSNVRAK